MSNTDVIDGIVVEEPGAELERVEPQAQPPANLFHTENPVEVLEKASEVAAALKDVLRKQGMVQNISGREHVKVDGWQTLGSMLGVVPVVTWTRELEDGWEARVEARTLDGRVVGAAEAMCTRREKMWKGRDPYALRSMAQTRATSKALRGPLGFVVTLAGYEGTPAEEMPHDRDATSAPVERRDVQTTGSSDVGQLDPDSLQQLIDAYTNAGKPEAQTAEKLDELGVPLDGLKVKVSPARFKRCTVEQALRLEDWLKTLSPAATADEEISF